MSTRKKKRSTFTRHAPKTFHSRQSLQEQQATRRMSTMFARSLWQFKKRALDEIGNDDQ